MSQNKKTVNFSQPLVTQYYIIPNEDRSSPWMTHAIDRIRFKRRIEDTEKKLQTFLINKIKRTIIKD